MSISIDEETVRSLIAELEILGLSGPTVIDRMATQQFEYVTKKSYGYENWFLRSTKNKQLEALAEKIERADLTQHPNRFDLVAAIKQIAERYVQETEDPYKLGRLLFKHQGLTGYWMIAALCFSALDITTARKAEKLGIKLTYTGRDGIEHYRNTASLLQDVNKRLDPKDPSWLNIAKTFSEEFRNNVLHKGLQVDEKTTSYLLDLIEKVCQSLEK